MAAHPDGTGTSWDEDVDVDRPHGLDYRYTNHVAKAVRKRMEKEHEDFADATVGGEHVPGMVQVLRLGDTSADISAFYDSTQFQKNGLAYGSGIGYLYCITGAAGDPTIVRLDPHCLCQGADLTWSGLTQFDATATFTQPIDASDVGVADLSVAGDISVQGALAVLGASDLSSVKADDLSCGGAAYFDASCDMSTASFAGPIDATGVTIQILGADTTQNSVAGSLAFSQVYQAETDGWLNMSVNLSTTLSNSEYIYIVAGDTSSPAGEVCYHAEGPAVATGTPLTKLWAGGFIRKGQYCSFTTNAASVRTIKWQPFGTGGLVLQ